MTDPTRRILLSAAALAMPAGAAVAAARVFDVRQQGARGDGHALDHEAFNRAIAAASGAGGGVVRVPAGRYLCFSIRLRSRVTLAFEPGAVLIAADPARDRGRYDAPEPNPHDLYQDFGHSHWRNSLIWGDGLEDVAIVGPGLIDGRGLTREGPGSRWAKGAAGDRPLSMGAAPHGMVSGYEAEVAAMDGLGNKAIALKTCRRVTLKDFTVLRGGHFAVLATGVEDLVIDGLTIDTNRDGIDLDAVRRARVTNCRLNSPNDDAIVLKSSWALGVTRPTEQVVVSDCQVSGYDLGTLLDGTRRRTQEISPDKDRVTGRIKLGTEATGGFRDITISDCRFERCRGLALESVDGAAMENIAVRGLTMREVTTAPIFIRTGDRRRAPPGAGLAASRNITLSDIDAAGIDPRFAAMVMGLAESPVENVRLERIRLAYAGALPSPVPRHPPENPGAYPEPSMFGPTPAWGLYLRHARNIWTRELELVRDAADARPPVLADDVHSLQLDGSAAEPGQAPRPLKL